MKDFIYTLRNLFSRKQQTVVKPSNRPTKYKHWKWTKIKRRIVKKLYDQGKSTHDIYEALQEKYPRQYPDSWDSSVGSRISKICQQDLSGKPYKTSKKTRKMHALVFSPEMSKEDLVRWERNIHNGHIRRSGMTGNNHNIDCLCPVCFPNSPLLKKYNGSMFEAWNEYVEILKARKISYLTGKIKKKLEDSIEALDGMFDKTGAYVSKSKRLTTFYPNVPQENAVKDLEDSFDPIGVDESASNKSQEEVVKVTQEEVTEVTQEKETPPEQKGNELNELAIPHAKSIMALEYDELTHTWVELGEEQ